MKLLEFVGFLFHDLVFCVAGLSYKPLFFSFSSPFLYRMRIGSIFKFHWTKTMFSEHFFAAKRTRTHHGSVTSNSTAAGINMDHNTHVKSIGISISVAVIITECGGVDIVVETTDGFCS